MEVPFNIPSTEVIQLTLTLKILVFFFKMTTAQVVEISVTANNSIIPIQESIHPDDHIPPNFTKLLLISFLSHFKVIYGECENDLKQPSIHLFFQWQIVRFLLIIYQVTYT